MQNNLINGLQWGDSMIPWYHLGQSQPHYLTFMDFDMSKTFIEEIEEIQQNQCQNVINMAGKDLQDIMRVCIGDIIDRQIFIDNLKGIENRGRRNEQIQMRQPQD